MGRGVSAGAPRALEVVRAARRCHRRRPPRTPPRHPAQPRPTRPGLCICIGLPPHVMLSRLCIVLFCSYIHSRMRIFVCLVCVRLRARSLRGPLFIPT